MQQGSTIAPRALSTRCVSGVWLVQRHTNMSAFAYFQLSDLHSRTPIWFCSVWILCILLHHGMHFILWSWSFIPKFPGHQGSRWESDGSCACIYLRHCLCTSAFAAKTSLPFIQTEHCHLHPYTPTHSSIHWKFCSVFSSQVRSYFNPPTLFTHTIYLHTPPCPFTYFYRWIHMFLSPDFPPQVGIHINHNLIVHRQPGCLPNSPEDGGADRISRRPGRSDGNRVRHHAWRIHNDLFSGQRLHTSLYVIDCLYS